MRYRSLKALLLSFLSTLLLIVCVFLYGRWIEPRWVEETHWHVESAHWQGRPIRIVVLADLHARPGDGDYLDSIVQKALAAKPDLIVLLGDYIDKKKESMELGVLGQHLAPLMQVPCYAVLGNHDVESHLRGICTMLEHLGVQLVDGGLQALEVGGDTLYISGIYCMFDYSEPAAPLQAPEGKMSILLTHSPAGALHAPAGTDCVLAAHTHGGQICLPGGIPLAGLDAGLKWWEYRGEIERKGVPVYISRGLGMSKVEFRFWSRPEIVVVDIDGGTHEGKRVGKHP